MVRLFEKLIQHWATSNSIYRTPPNCNFEMTISKRIGLSPVHLIIFTDVNSRVRSRISTNYFLKLMQLQTGRLPRDESFRIEIFADDDSLDKAVFTKQWVPLLQEAAIKHGKPMANMDEWPDKMKKAGSRSVTMHIVKVPMNPWPKDPKQKAIGRYMQFEQEQAAPGYTNALLSRNSAEQGRDRCTIGSCHQ